MTSIASRRTSFADFLMARLCSRAVRSSLRVPRSFPIEESPDGRPHFMYDSGLGPEVRWCSCLPKYE